MKDWINKAYAYLDKSLGKVPVELNEVDWKESLSPNNDKLCRHISAFANLPGGGFIVFGIKNKSIELVGVDIVNANQIIEKLSSLCRDSVEPLVKIDISSKLSEGKNCFLYT